MFKMRDEVSWSSQAMGNSTEKSGQVVAVVPAKARPEACVPAGLIHSAKFGGAGPRSHESYLVLVDLGAGKKPTLYWPLVSRLHKVTKSVRSGPTETLSIDIKGHPFNFHVLADLPGIDYPQTRSGALSRARVAQKQVISNAQDLLAAIDEEIVAEMRQGKQRRMKVPDGQGKTLVFELKSTGEKLTVRSEKVKTAKAEA